MLPGHVPKESCNSCYPSHQNNAQLPSDKTCYVAWTSSSQSEAELACIWCLSSDTFRLERHRNHHLETSYQVHLLSSLVSILPALQPCWIQGKTYRACCPVMCQKNCATHATQAIKITHNFHLTRRAMWHGHLALNQKQNWLVSGAYLQTHSDWSGTEIIILRLHIKCIFCQAWFRFCPPCNHVGFKEKPTERVARSCAKRIKNKAPLPSDKTCYVAWTSNARSEAELACIWCLSSDIQTGAAQKSSS